MVQDDGAGMDAVAAGPRRRQRAATSIDRLADETAEALAVADVAGETGAAGRAFSGDHVGFMDDMLALLREQADSLAQAVAAGDGDGGLSTSLAVLLKDYAKIAVSRELAARANRASNDGLIHVDRVAEMVDSIHAIIPARIETAMVNGEAEARAAMAGNTWKAWCERFRTHTLGGLAERNFGMVLRGAEADGAGGERAMKAGPQAPIIKDRVRLKGTKRQTRA